MSADPLIYDIGLHKGEDSEFYLKKGFRVIGVDADPDLCELARRRLKPFVDSGKLKIVNVAIADTQGITAFYRNEMSDWGTIVHRWAAQNAARGYSFDKVTVEAVTLADLILEHGEAYYIKIDIEGMDRVALRSMRDLPSRPKYISIESAYPRDLTLKNAAAELAALNELGFDRFKIVPQHEVLKQVPPYPAEEGRYTAFHFEEGSSGMFGEEAPGEWLSAEQAQKVLTLIILKSWPEFAVERCRWIHRAYLAVKRRLIRRPWYYDCWYDIHATCSGIAMTKN